MRAKKKRLTDEVENALYRRAIGYIADEMTVTPDEDGERITKIVRKPVAPSIQAQILWLRAYRPEIWGKSGTAAESDESAAELFKALDRAGARGSAFDDKAECENAFDIESDDESDDVSDDTFDFSCNETEVQITDERDGGG
jgi:hypothetical protein